jgi:hypothetical protein
MSDEDWGFFVDLESDPNLKEKNIYKKNQRQQNYQKNVDVLSVIYEEEVWYTRDDDDDNDYKHQVYNRDYNDDYNFNKNNKIDKNEEPGYLNNTSLAACCFICVSVISWSIILL